MQPHVSGPGPGSDHWIIVTVYLKVSTLVVDKDEHPQPNNDAHFSSKHEFRV